MATKTKNPFSSLANGTYYGEIIVEIGCTNPNAFIYYTLDGSTPTTNSNKIKANTEITISGLGTTIITCFALDNGKDGSDIITFNYNIEERLNLKTTNTTDVYQDTFSNTLEPIDSKGAQPYIDLTQFLSSKIRQQDGFMELVYMFQDYLNNGFRVIPYFKKEITITNKDLCSYTSNTTYEYLEPYNHDISMILDYENNSQDLDNVEYIEQYNKTRDISTFSINDDLLNTYKQTYSDVYYDSIFYNSFVYYRNTSELIKKTITYPFEIFLSTVDSYLINSSDLETQFMLTSEIINKLSGVTAKIKLNIYFCGYEDFLEHFKYTGSFYVNEYFYPTFYNKVDVYNENSDRFKYYGNYTDKTSFLNILPQYSNRFRVTIELDNVSKISGITDIDYPMTIILEITSLTDIESIPSNIPFLSQRFLLIKKWQDPEIFYNYFSNQNENRIDDKKGTILDKISKIAYMHDPEVIDSKYINFIASQLGYNIEIDREDIETSGIYVTEEEQDAALREVIKRLPNFYKIKCTKNGLESLLLSFGIVGEIVYLYTIGDDTRQGYSDFVDARVIEGYDDEGPYTNSDFEKYKQLRLEKARLANTVLDDWFPSPHFRVEIDLLKQNLRLNKNKMKISMLNKVVKKAKPINTVFQGFYGTMVEKFGEIFIYSPKGMNKGFIKSAIGDKCVTVDTWVSDCNGTQV